jgi:hypothetical protein
MCGRFGKLRENLRVTEGHREIGVAQLLLNNLG